MCAHHIQKRSWQFPLLLFGPYGSALLQAARKAAEMLPAAADMSPLQRECIKDHQAAHCRLECSTQSFASTRTLWCTSCVKVLPCSLCAEKSDSEQCLSKVSSPHVGSGRYVETGQYGSENIPGHVVQVPSSLAWRSCRCCCSTAGSTSTRPGPTLTSAGTWCVLQHFLNNWY